MRPKAMVLGASGQDGPYLAEALHRRGYEVWGCVPSWDPRKHTTAERAPHMKLIEADLSDPYLSIRLLTYIEPAVVFNMAAITFVPQSWDLAELTVDTNGVFAVSGILFNHESPWRGPEFVTRHVTTSAARAAASKVPMSFPIGRTDTIRDWGHAADYVEAMITMMERDEPDDFVIGTGVAHTVGELIEVACEVAGVSVEVFEMDVSRMRPAETAPLIADASRARRILGWEPTRTFEQMIEEMVLADMDRVERGEL